MTYQKSNFIIVFLLLVLLLVSCKEYGPNGQDINENNQNVTSDGENKENKSQVKSIENFEGQWNRTQVASYEQATISKSTSTMLKKVVWEFKNVYENMSNKVLEW